MQTTSKMVGILGEELAACFLAKAGYRILLKNYRSRLGEIDLVAKDRETLVFIEVKTRRSLAAGDPSESVTAFKQRQIVKTAQCYLKSLRLEDIPCRFDVVSILLNTGEDPMIEHIHDAFGA